mmetsp:Transcript_3342/g.7694  ORF Transcript_3342/g.7694 Transcript_3342/m.7694 type:complete len:215 (-) Transcript_3342:3-647(-)
MGSLASTLDCHLSSRSVLLPSLLTCLILFRDDLSSSALLVAIPDSLHMCSASSRTLSLPNWGTKASSARTRPLSIPSRREALRCPRSSERCILSLYPKETSILSLSLITSPSGTRPTAALALLFSAAFLSRRLPNHSAWAPCPPAVGAREGAREERAEGGCEAGWWAGFWGEGSKRWLRFERPVLTRERAENGVRAATSIPKTANPPKLGPMTG